MVAGRQANCRVLLAGDDDKSADVAAYDAETGQQTARAGWDGRR